MPTTNPSQSMQTNTDTQTNAGAREATHTVSDRIRLAVASTNPDKERKAALCAIKWVLVCEAGYANQGELLNPPYIVPDICNATVFDGRDSEETKARWYSAALRTHCVAVLLP